MLSYEFYKVFHLTSIVILLTSFSVSFFGGVPSKYSKFLNGLATFFVLVGGMGLMARIGITHGEMWPNWILVKVFIWLLIGVGGAIIIKRKPQWGKKIYWPMIFLFIVAAYSANIKY